MQYGERNSADTGLNQSHRFGVVSGCCHRLNATNVTLAQDAHDPLSAINGGAQEFDHALSDREDPFGFLSFPKKRSLRREDKVVNRCVDLAKILLIEVSEQHHVANTAAAAIRSSLPGGVDLDGNHVNKELMTNQVATLSAIRKGSDLAL